MRWWARCLRPSRLPLAWLPCCFPNMSGKSRQPSCGRLRSVYTPVLRWSLSNRTITIAIGLVFLAVSGFIGTRLGSEFLPTLEEGNLWIRASMPPTISLGGRNTDRRQNPGDYSTPSRSYHGGVPTWPSRQRQRCGRILQCGVLRAAEALRRVARGLTKEKLIDQLQDEFIEGIRRYRLQLFAIHPRQCRGRIVGRQRRQLCQDYRP